MGWNETALGFSRAVGDRRAGDFLIFSNVHWEKLGAPSLGFSKFTEMKDLTSIDGPLGPQPRRWRQHASRLGVFFGVFAAIVAAILFLFTRIFDSARLVHTDVCGNGISRLSVYKYSGGAGYVELTDRNGKVFGQSDFPEGAYLDPEWSDDCLAVTVGTDTDRVKLGAARQGR